MTAIAKYAWIGYTSIRSSLAYPGEIAARTTFMATILYVFLRLWTAVYTGAGAERLGGLTLNQMLWYLMITEAVVLSAPRVTLEVDEDVRTGKVAVQLLRPMSYALAVLGKTLGERIVRFGVNLACGTVIALILAGPISFTASGLAMFAFVLPLAFILDSLGYLMIGLFAFWFESTIGLALLYSRLTMLLGGMLMPLEVFPDRWQMLLHWLPFATVVYGPARMFVAPDLRTFAGIASLQTAWLVAFSLAAGMMERIAVKRIQSHGG